MWSMEVNLTAQQQAFIEENLQSGRFASADEAVRAAVELLEQQEHELQLLRDAVDEADDDIANGRFVVYTDDTLPQLLEDVKSDVQSRPETNPGSLSR